mmetsp:Transcript_14837/g.38297  ORF Transcript_14837/g.38297 Transcript_14837/m.38297 type:complete len:247 (-) Transcript_14837:725-1465(-)
MHDARCATLRDATSHCTTLRHLRTQCTGHDEGSLDALGVVEARVAEGFVVVAEHLLEDVHAAARALGHRGLPCHLEVHARQVRAELAVNLQRLRALAQDVVELTSLHLVGRCDRVAVHAIALPDDGHATRLYRADVRRQHRLDLSIAVAGDEHESSLDLIGVENLHELLQLVGCHAWANLAANRVLDATEILDVPARQLARAVADPHHVCAQVVVLVADGARESLLEVELHRLMRGEERAADAAGW